MPLIDRMRATQAAAAAIGLATCATTFATSLDTSASTTLDTADLEQRGIVSLEDIAAATPDISYTRALNSLSTLSIYMRGEGPVAPGQITLDGAVGIYQDGFAVSRLQANTFDLLDLERAEVLTGPQGALFGRDTPGGVINLVSQAPSGELRFDQDVAFGNRNSYRILSSLDSPRWHGLSAKLTLLASSIDGYVRNELGSSHDYGSEKQRAARLQLRWEGPSGLRFDYFLERTGLDSTPEYDSNPSQNGEQLYGVYTYYADPNGPMHSTYRPIDLPLSTSNHTAQGLTLSWRALEALLIESRTGYRTMIANEQQDYAEFYGEPLGTGDSYNQYQLSQDLRFSGDLFDRQLAYLAGGSYFKDRGWHESDITLLPYFSGFPDRGNQLERVSAETRSLSYYARLVWRPAILRERLEISAAARYTRDSKDAARWITRDGDVLESDARNHLSYGRATPEYSLNYHWTEDIATYAKVSTAYVAGGALETAPNGSFGTTAFRPESSTTYEIGLKSNFIGGRLGAELALFDSRRRDVQYALPVDLITADVLDFQRVTVKGAHFGLRYSPLRDLSLSTAGTYLHSSIDRVDAPAQTGLQGWPYVAGQNINTLFVLPYAPKYSASVAGDYTALHLDRKDVLLHLDYVYRARMFAEAAAGPGVPGGQFDTQPAYGLLTGRITLSQETDWAHRVKISIWGRNLLNRKYYQPAFAIGDGLTSFNTSGGAAVPTGYQSRAGAWAEPMTYGLDVRYEY